VVRTFKHVELLLQVLDLAPDQHVGEQEEVTALYFAFGVDLLHEALVQIVSPWFIQLTLQ